jgi:tetratricopeptide (TPR) repeat protein
MREREEPMQFKTWQAFIVAASLLLAPLPAWAGANLQQLLQMGADALKTGNSFLATQKYQEAVDKNPNSHQAWYALAEAQYKSQNFKAAIKSVSKALGLAPDRPLVLAKYHTGRAWACYKAGLYGQAVTDMERATELAPNNRQYKKWLNGRDKKSNKKAPAPACLRCWAMRRCRDHLAAIQSAPLTESENKNKPEMTIVSPIMKTMRKRPRRIAARANAIRMRTKANGKHKRKKAADRNATRKNRKAITKFPREKMTARTF